MIFLSNIAYLLVELYEKGKYNFEQTEYTTLKIVLATDVRQQPQQPNRSIMTCIRRKPPQSKLLQVVH